MRYLRIFAICLFVFSLVFSFWANARYAQSVNTDIPVLENAVDILEISVNDPPEAMLQGLSAWDKTDGDLTDKIMVAAVSHFIEPSTVNVNYVVFDSHHNADTLTRQVRYTDYTSPTFSLERNPVYQVGQSFDFLRFVHAGDCIDGDISDNIRVISNMVNNYTPGNYPVVLEVSNSCGDTAQITLWVTYLTKAPTAAVTLIRHIVYVQQGESFDPQQYLVAVTDLNATHLDQTLVQVQGNLDINTPGCYQLVYTYDDGTLSGQAPLTVVVTERQG